MLPINLTVDFYSFAVLLRGIHSIEVSFDKKLCERKQINFQNLYFSFLDSTEEHDRFFMRLIVDITVCFSF